MGFFRVQEKAGKTKRKPGWQKAQADYEAWLNGVKSQTTSFARTARPVTVKKVSPVVPQAPIISKDRGKGISLGSLPTGGTKPVHRPEILYKDNPEMLERELLARQRKFNAAPAYNKGAAQFVSEEELQNLLSSNKRRS